MKALAQAVRLLTALPWPGALRDPEAEVLTGALARFPFIGLLIGAILIALDWALAGVLSVSVRSVLLVIALIVLTRGSSLSGLSNLTDALGIGNHGKGGSPGSMGVLIIIGALLLKIVALNELQENERYLALMVAPVLARSAMAYLIASSPSVREAEEGGREPDQQSRPGEGYMAMGWSFLLCFFLAWFWGLFLAIVALGVTWGLKRLLDRSEKEVGDAPGGVGEIVESMTLVLFSA